jgi:tetratricopeptide (TPR) repeat protein
VIPIVIGFAMSRPITESLNVHANELFRAGLAAQLAGQVVSAEEDYAMVLSLYPSNEYTRFNLGVRQQDAGHIDQAISLYQKALDPNFAAAEHNMEYIRRRHFGFADLHRP